MNPLPSSTRDELYLNRIARKKSSNTDAFENVFATMRLLILLMRSAADTYYPAASPSAIPHLLMSTGRPRRHGCDINANIPHLFWPGVSFLGYPFIVSRLAIVRACMRACVRVCLCGLMVFFEVRICVYICL